MVGSVFGVFVAPEEQVTTRGDGGEGGIGAGHQPLIRNGEVIGEVVAGQVDGRGGGVVDFHPVLELALRVGHHVIVVGHVFLM
jgi:hypothetical protein